MKDFDDVADFTIVYIEEAHPIEGWRIKVRSSDSLSLYRNGLNTEGLFKVCAGLFPSSLQTAVTSAPGLSCSNSSRDGATPI